LLINQYGKEKANAYKNQKKAQQEGFYPLIELMIVIAIIGILAAIAIPQFAAYRAKSYNSAAQSDLRNVLTVLEAYYADFQRYPSGG
jgi:type IV pilus assembly protein PilA